MAPSVGRRETISQLFDRNGLKVPYADSFNEFVSDTEPVMLTVGPLYQGLSTEGITLLTETELTPQRPVAL